MALTIKTTGIEDYLDGGEAFVKALVAGPPSAGKTRSASFWPKPIFADCEKGRMSIADRKVPYGEVTSTDDMLALIRNLRVECAKPVASRRFQTLVIDTIDAYQRIVIQERLTSERKEAFQGYQDWGFLDAKMTQLISALLSLPMNIVVNMHVKESKEGDDGPVTIIPKLKGDIRDQIAAEFDLVGLMGTTWVAEGGERVLQRSIQWHPDPRVPWLKDRSGQLPKYTPVTFADDDYTGLLVPLSAALDRFEASEEVMVMESEADYLPAPVAPGSKDQAGGAVAAPVAPAKKAAAPAKKAPAKAPAARPTMEVEGLPAAGAESAPPAAAPAAAVPAAPRPTVPAAPKPVAAAPAEAPPGTTTPVEGGEADKTTGELPTEPTEPPATDEQALALVQGELGGEVTREIIAPDEDPPIADAGPAPEAPAAPTAPAQAVPTCGSPGKNAKGDLNPDPISGCGKSLADENRDVVNIGFIRSTREGRPTYLCAACIAAHKAAKAS